MNPYFNENTILAYIKKMLGVPFNILELNDETLINDVILDHSFLKEFSQYFPKEERITLSQENNERTIIESLKKKNPNKYKDINFKNKFHNVWLLDSKNEIIGIRDIIHNPANDILAYYGDIMTYANPVETATYDLTRSMIEKPITFKFYYPNKVEVLGYNRSYDMIAIVDVVHDKDLSSIPSSLHLEYQKLCLYNTANLVLHIRQKYNNMSTPFGELNINVEWMQELAGRKQELLQQFKSPGNFASRGMGMVVL